MVRLTGIRSSSTRNSHYYIDVKATPYTVVVTTRYEDSTRDASVAILSRDQALELAKVLLAGALTVKAT